MSFVLQLGTMEASLEKKNVGSNQTSSMLLSQESSHPVVDNEDGGKSQILQCIEATSEIPTGHVISFSTVKSVSVTYPVTKSTREVQKLTGSQTNTTQVLTTRVISQKLPSSSHQTPLTLNASPHVTHIPVNAQSLSSPGNGVAHLYPLQHVTSAQSKHHNRNQVVGCESKQQATIVSGLQASLHQKIQSVPSQQLVTSGTVKAISTATSMPNIQRIHAKAQNLVGQSQTVNLQKVKAVTNVSQGVTVQRNSVPRIQTVQKGQVLSTSAVQGTQFAVNQVVNNANVQRVQQGNSTIQKAQSNIMAAQKVTQVYNNQKVPSQILGSHSNHKTQHQQIANNQQQGMQKLQGQPQKNLTVPRQQLTATVNNVQKSCNSVAGIQKAQVLGQVQGQQQSPQVHHKHGQQIQSSQHQRSQSAAALQKSQTVAAVNSNRVQSITNVCKSNSVPNIAKSQQNSNLMAVTKQQTISSQSQSQQVHAQNSSQSQLQLLQQTSQPQQQLQQHASSKQQQQQQQTNVNQQVQRTHNITNVHQKVTAVGTMPNNQRTQVVNSKVQQQQMVMRVGVPKSQVQNLQQASLKSVPQKIANAAKMPNSQNAVQQSLHRNINSQPVKIIQQQQNVIGPQNAQKQPGCIKTIPPQKSAQRNHQQKVTGFKTSLNANVTAVKSQVPVAAIAQKASIKTLLPQQTVTPNMLIHKNQPIKVQQQTIQQKQLIMASQYPQQVRQQAGQIKTLLPVTSTEPRKDVENKIESESRVTKEDEHQQTAPKSPIRRMPLPYECLQFVLQDHNYGAPPPRTPPPPSPPPHPKQQPINGAGSSTATSQHPYIYGQVVTGTNVEDDAASAISSEAGREAEPEGEETETAPEGEGDDEDSVTRCICDFEHDDGYMICCDRCLVWQHVDCMGIDRSNIPDEYLCEICRPRRVDRQRARALQMRKREELLNSDTSSDTSSTSSADTDIGVNTVPKKRTLQHQVPRRKSEPPPQVRRLNNNNNNNNNVAKRQRRDSHPRQSSTVRKKEVTKRGPGKRKVKRRMSLEDKEEETQDTWSSSNVAPLRQWIERYEEAVTNHYSPELRARISSIKVNGTHSDLRQSNMNAIATGKCRLNVHSNNVRFLVATMYLPPNTPVVELRGKYMLSTQHRPAHPQGRQHIQRPGPFVFFYRLPRDGTEVCVDTRTYGNDARFVRRSCKPNAEVKHCIEKGTLHLYIVTTTAVEKNAEITIRHEQHDLLLSPNPNGPMIPIFCACNNPRECQIAPVNQLTRRGSNGAIAESADGRERRRRARRNTVCEDSDPTPVIPSTSVTPTTPPSTTVPSVSAPPRRTITTTVANTTRQPPKEETPATIVQQPQISPTLSQAPAPESKKDKKKMTREERKMEAIMKAFERLEKAEQRKQEVQARNAQRKESGSTHSDNDDTPSVTMQSKQKQQNSERPLRRKRRKGRTRTTSSSQSQGSSRRTRLNSADSDVSSGEESNSMQSPPLLSQNHSQNRDLPYSSHLHTPAKNTNETVNPGSGHQGISTAAGLLLALANSNAPGPSSPPLQQPTPVKSPTCDSGASSSSQSSTPSTPLSSACLLVAAAVGPLAPGFKFPKTKKVLMNEWLKESPDPPQSNITQVSPLPVLPSAPLSNSINPLCRSSDFSLPTDSSAEFLTQSYAAKSLATLVQAANSVSGICDSPPQRKQAISGNTVCPVSTGSAKKRWLRQAISEECDSPNSRPESPPPSEMVAPPKKRRIARESLSSDNYTPPTTPTMLIPESIPNNRSMCPADDDFIEHLQSPLIEQNDERNLEAESIMKEEINSHERVNQNENLRQKLSIDIPQDFHLKSMKSEESTEIIQMDTLLVKKDENVEVKEELKDEIDCDSSMHLDSKPFVKEELRSVESEMVDHHKDKVKKEHNIKEEQLEIEKGTVEIIDQNEGDTEMEDLSSPIAAMESDAILKQRVAEMRLEFEGSIADIENDKSDDEEKFDNAKCEDKSDDNMSIDEFDVEAQMKKITGDDGNDYKEKIDTSSEKDKSMDGIEGLMESSKEDSESEDKEMDDVKYEPSFKSFGINHEERLFKEFESKPEHDDTLEENVKDVEHSEESQKAEQPSVFVASSEESIFESTSSNMDTESLVEPPKIFHSIPPLSERIRKKTEVTNISKSQLNFEAAIIESTIDIESTDESKNGEQKSMLSTALRELLEAKLDDLTPEEVKEETTDENSTSYTEPKSETSEQSVDVQESTLRTAPQEIPVEDAFIKEDEIPPKEIKRLKDPRTVVPNNMPAPAFKPEASAPVKRKLSISEYRKRKQQSSGTPPEPEPSNDTPTTDKGGARGRSDSASSGTSSLSSDEEGSKISLSLDLPGLTALPIFTNAESEEKKVGMI
ncbi:uncharacterized protein LOC122402396 isoform X4 [Colletes gigas]|uniref:uncharacterized protein LOC122402396 isoform X4 n=1 Tax=Colletes gigas TaxID=935657 RepID=UPI001C9A5899|nr:uncharacterized protein LOC122402396 isoform X4 [Colletes gigas]